MRTDDEWEQQWLMRIGSITPAFWSEVVLMQLRRIERGAEAHRTRGPRPERRAADDGFAASLSHDLGPIQADAYFLLAAVRHILTLADRYAERFDAERFGAALTRFNAEAPDAKNLRDVLTHLEDCAIGRGKHSRFKAEGQWSIQVGLDFGRGEFDLRAGTQQVELRRTARAAGALADALSEIAPPAGA
jgi:hypothetical protein